MTDSSLPVIMCGIRDCTSFWKTTPIHVVTTPVDGYTVYTNMYYVFVDGEVLTSSHTGAHVYIGNKSKTVAEYLMNHAENLPDHETIEIRLVPISYVNTHGSNQNS